MKKKIIVLLGVLTLSAFTLAGCGQKSEQTDLPDAEGPAPETVEEPADTAETAEEPVAEDAQEDEPLVGMANPWVEITEEEANAECARLFKAPEGATIHEWLKCDELGDPQEGLGPMVQLNFELDGVQYTARAQMGASEDADISGVYAEWVDGPSEVTLSNWGEGNMVAQTYRSIDDTGYLDLITWYDVEIGIKYALTAAAEDLDGFDITAVADQMYAEDHEPLAGMPVNFLDEQAGKSDFADFDEVISYLEEGQGYATISLKGYDGDVLAVTELVFEADHSAERASLYIMEDGAAKYIGDVSGNGSAYPLRFEDGIIYCGDNHRYETYFASSDYTGIMCKDSVEDDVSTDGAGFIGTLRESNDFDHDKEFDGGQEEFDKLIAEREKKPVIEFTVK